MNEKQDLKEWMDQRGLKAADVARDMRVDEATVRNWRSQGVPDRRRPHVERYMAEWVDPSASAVPVISEESIQAFRERQNLVLKPSENQFEAWDRASRKDGAETLQEWAMRGLDLLAEKQEGNRDAG